ncbi:MAG: hypothetical protein GWP25_07525 [Euryarchaeota archaeon]|nr:hypothetical protein [Euryarchaeota archaeon]
MGGRNKRIWQTEVPERAPLIVGVISCAVLTVWNLSRGLNLWAGYNFGGAMMALLALLILWKGRAHIPALPLWIGYSASMLHFFGGSLGAADSDLGPLCFDGMNPGEWLCADGVNGMYHVHPWWDKLVHVMNSTALAIAWSLGWRRMSEYNGWQLSPRVVAFTAFSLSVAIGVAYEVYEFFGKTFFQTIDQGGYVNTATDLVSDMLGAGLGVLFTHFYDPMNKTSDKSGQSPLPPQVTLTNNGSTPIMAIGAILSFDFLLLNGGIVNSDYDFIGQLMLTSLFVSGLMVARRLFLNSQAKQQKQG